MIKKPTGWEILFYATVTVIAVLLCVIYILTPRGADDLNFLLGTQNFTTFSEFASALPGEIVKRWGTETGRFGTLLSLPFLYLSPKWVFAIFTGLIVTVLIRYAIRLAEVSAGSLLSWLILGVFVFVFPWYDYLFLETYSLNYVWGGAFALMAAYYFMRAERLNGTRLYAVCLLAIFAGWFHEAYGAPLCAGATLWLISNRKVISYRSVLVWLFLGVGTGITFLSPVPWERVQYSSKVLEFPVKEFVMQLGPGLLIVGVFILAMVIVLLSGRGKEREGGTSFNKGCLWFFCGFTALSFYVFVKHYCGPRTGAPLILFSSTGAAWLFGTLKGSASRLVRMPAFLVFGIGSMAHLGYAAAKQADCRREYDDIVKLFEESETGEFYYDLTYPVADASLFKTSVRQFHERIPVSMWEWYYSKDTDKRLVILPTAMKGFSPEKAQSSRLTPGAWIYNGWIVLPGDYPVADIVRIGVLTPEGEEVSTRLRVVRFKSEDKNEYILIVPHVKTLNPEFNIVDVNMKDSSRI